MNTIEIRSPRTTEEWNQYYDLRYRILRKPWNQPFESALTPEDKTATHFALFEAQEIISIARLDQLNAHTAQVRFVATDSHRQQQGFGKRLMLHIENYCLQSNYTTIILEARKNAMPLYLSLGYTITKEGKLLFNEIPHFWMEKHLTAL